MWIPGFLVWESTISFEGIVVPIVTAFTILYVGSYLVRCFITDVHILIPSNARHSWTSLDSLAKLCSCGICEALLMEGYFCDCCGSAVDSGCLKFADKALPCKMVASNDKGPMKHHWVRGNISVDARCYVCEEECSNDVDILDLECCWCHRAVHIKCHAKLGNVCDFGWYRQFVVPPQCIELVGRRASISNRLRIRRIRPVSWPDWSPIIVIANRNSGNKDGGRILSMFRKVLNPAQVVDLSILPPEAIVEWCSLIGQGVATTFIVAGGDGTIAWVLNTIYKMKVKPVPAVGVIPLGTGNDLSRVLGWGKAYSPAEGGHCRHILEAVLRAQCVSLDRWKVDVAPQRHLGLPLSSSRHLFMYNYLSVGVDAQVTLDFHRTRESRFYIVSSRLFNKVLYLLFGTQQVMERICQDLDQRIELYLDGEKQDLPSIEAIVVLNIPSWGAGVDLWAVGADEETELPVQSFSDGKLEVVAIYSSFHIAQLQVGLSQPHRIGQASNIKIKVKGKTAMQVDGEPWIQHPSEITISSCDNQASVLSVTDFDS